MARSLEPLVVGKVIGDVLDMYNPVAEFTVRYGSKQIANGWEIKPSVAAEMPHVQIMGSRFFSLISIPWLWLILMPQVLVNQNGENGSTGHELVPYMGPQPPTGIHRYVFALFKQKAALMGRSRPPDGRGNFSTRQFAAQHGFGLPVAAVYFNSQKEPAVKKR
ncbi:hypothetical protein GH714_018503 [Hevea brasiliensis]|uniref:Uncharacterized protein n=1 Tax=Hevea brasiliensis TaxID=3981 RepID=A0A6A6LTK1_HEVBR|nr:hypothetical protein GH714_018503 [Hevea brasiliensis]